MKIYADVLVVTNCIVELIYLQTTALFTHRRLNKGRLCAACLFGGAMSLLFCADGGTFAGALAITISKAVSLLLTLLIGVKFSRVGDFFRTLLIYLAVRAAYTGLIIIWWEFSQSRLIMVRNFTTYFDISLLKLTAALITAYCLLTVCEFLKRRFRNRAVCYRAVYRSGDYEVQLPAVADTGNRLNDSFTGLPVVVFCCDEMYSHYTLYDPEAAARTGFRLTPYSTIDGSGLIAVTSKGTVTITDEQGNNKVLRCCTGVKPSSGKHSRAVFDPVLLE